MSDSSRLDYMLDNYRSAMLGPGIQWSACKTRLSIVWSTQAKRYSKLGTALGIVLLLCGAFLLSITFMQEGQDSVFILGMILVSVGLVATLLGILYCLDYVDTALDFHSRRLEYGRRIAPFSKVVRIGVRRNTRNERFRGGVIEHVPDKRLMNVSVIIHVSMLRQYYFGAFNSTDVAVRFARELAVLMRLDEDIIVDGARKLPGVCYRSEDLIGTQFSNQIITNEMFLKLLYSLDPTYSNCAQLDLTPVVDEVFRTALLWKGGYHFEQKGKDLYIPNSIVFFDIDDVTPTQKDCCFISQIHGQLEVRVIKDAHWSGWLDAVDRSEPCPNEPIFLDKLERSFLAMIRETEKRGITLQSHPRKHYIPLSYVDAWVTVASLCDWSPDDCEGLRDHLSERAIESVDSFAILKLVEDYCAGLYPEKLLFIYLDSSSTLAEVFDQLRIILSNGLEVVHSLINEYFENIESPSDCARAIAVSDFFLVKHKYQITEVKSDIQGRCFFIHRERNTRVLKQTVATCFSI